MQTSTALNEHVSARQAPSRGVVDQPRSTDCSSTTSTWGRCGWTTRPVQGATAVDPPGAAAADATRQCGRLRAPPARPRPVKRRPQMTDSRAGRGGVQAWSTMRWPRTRRRYRSRRGTRRCGPGRQDGLRGRQGAAARSAKRAGRPDPQAGTNVGHPGRPAAAQRLPPRQDAGDSGHRQIVGDGRESKAEVLDALSQRYDAVKDSAGTGTGSSDPAAAGGGGQTGSGTGGSAPSRAAAGGGAGARAGQ